jgi:hypothetical protein
MPITLTQQPYSYTATSGNSARSTTQTSTTADNRIIAMRSVTDDGAGAFADALGTVDYAGKAVSLKVIDFDRSTTSYQSDYEDGHEFANTATNGSSNSSNTKGGNYGSASVGEELFAGASLVARYRVGASSATAYSGSFTPPAVIIDLTPYTTDRIVPGSLRFVWMGQTYEDQDGYVYRLDGADRIRSGTINYASGHLQMTDYVVGGSGPADFTLLSLWTSKGAWKTASLFALTSAAPVVPSQFTLFILDTEGNALTATGDLSGNLVGDHVNGRIDYQSGLVELQFGDFVLDAGLSDADKAQWWYDAGDVGAVEAGKIWRPWPVDPASLRYNIVSNLYLPIDPEILGLNPTRLPQDGRVPIFAKGRVLIIGHNDQLAPDTYSAGEVDCGRERLSHVWLIDANGELITSGWSATEADLDAGKVQITDVTGWAQPVTVEHRIQDMALCTDVQIDGTLSINIPLSHDYPAGSVVSSALLFGTSFARVANLFDQQAWDGITWADAVTGNPAVASYNDTAYPVVVTNAGALPDRYALRFKADSTTFDFISQNMGQLGSGSKNADYAPANPIQQDATPMLTLASAGWGSGWVAGNTLFLRVEAAMQSMAVIRTVQPGSPAGIDYSFDLLTGGDVGRPPEAP